MWHSHMQEPLHYVADCLRLLGRVIYHSPRPTLEHDRMQSARDQSDGIWKGEFEIDIMTDHLFHTYPDWDNERQ